MDISTEFSKNATLIESFIQDVSVKAGRPLKVFLDITCVPKSYLLFILGLGFSRNYVCRLDCIYSEGAYALADLSGEPAGGEKARGIISEGEWESLQVPYLGAERAIPSARDLFVTMGGEIGLSLPFIEKYEPAKLGLVLIKESLIQTPEKLLPSERAALNELLSEPNVLRKDVGLCDVVALTKETVAFCAQSQVDAVSGIALGAKPHALALGIAALSQENLEIVCRIPKRYRPLDVAPLLLPATWLFIRSKTGLNRGHTCKPHPSSLYAFDLGFALERRIAIITDARQYAVEAAASVARRDRSSIDLTRPDWARTRFFLKLMYDSAYDESPIQDRREPASAQSASSPD